MTETPSGPPVDLYAELAPRLADEDQRLILRALLDHLAAGGGTAVQQEVRRRLLAILEEDA